MMISRNPYTGEEISSIKKFSKQEIEAAIKAAHESFKTWRNTSFKDRAQLMEKAAEELEKNKRMYAETITKEMGKPIYPVHRRN
jgi:succinate-semialdehyde dehydrogenase / glutarate-semialdehyde dehydrogenase